MSFLSSLAMVVSIGAMFVPGINLIAGSVIISANVARGLMIGAIILTAISSVRATDQSQTTAVQAHLDPGTPIPVVYGRARVGSIVVDWFLKPNDSNKILYMVTALCHGSRNGQGIGAIEEIWLNQQRVVVTNAAGGVFGAPLAAAVWSPPTIHELVNYYLFSGDTAHNVAATTMTGWNTPGNPQIPNETLASIADSNWDVNTDRGQGIACIAFRFANRSEYQQYGNPNSGTKLHFGGPPAVSAIVLGNYIFDTRTGTWIAGLDNPAMCLRDYLLSTVYGAGYPPTWINEQSVIDAANICDELVVYQGSTPQKRYTCNGIVDTGQTVGRNIDLLRSSFRCELVWEQGQWKMVVRTGNGIENPGLEVDAVGWRGSVGATVTRDNAQAHTGTWAAKIVTTNANFSGAQLTMRSGTRPTAAPGKSYTFSYWLYATGTAIGKNWYAYVNWYDKGGSIVSAINTSTVLVAGWQLLSVSGVAPAGTATADCEVICNGAQGVLTVWVDDADFSLTPVLTLDPVMMKGEWSFRNAGVPDKWNLVKATYIDPGAGEYRTKEVQWPPAPASSPTIILARKSSSQPGGNITPALTRLQGLGYNVTEDYAATMITCRAYSMVVVDCDVWSADEHSAFIASLLADGQKVMVSGNDSSTGLFYVTAAGNTGWPGAGAVGVARKIVDHPVWAAVAPPYLVSDPDNGYHITTVSAASTRLGNYMNDANGHGEDVAGTSVIEVADPSGGKVLHVPRFLLAGVRPDQFFINAVAYLFQTPLTNANPYLVSDGGYLNRLELSLPFTQDSKMAQAIAQITLNESRYGITVQAQCPEAALACSIEDKAAVRHPTPGWTAKPFWISSIQLRSDSSVDLALKEYDPGAYVLSPLDAPPVTSETNLPAVTAVIPPGPVTVVSGTTQDVIRIAWDATDYGLTDYYEIQTRQTDGDNVYRTAGRVTLGAVREFIQGGVRNGQMWQARVRTVNFLGYWSDWVESIVAMVVTHDLPLVTLTLAGVADGVTVTVSNFDTDADGIPAARVEIYARDNAAASGVDPLESAPYHVATIMPGQGAFLYSAVASRYVRVFGVPFNAWGDRGVPTAVSELVSGASGGGPSSPPTALACPTCTAGVSNDPEDATITWTDGDATAVYVLTQNGVEVARIAAGIHTYTFVNLISDTPYVFGVAAYKNGVYNPTSPLTIAVRTLRGTLGAPQNLVVAALFPAQVKLTWTMGTAGDTASHVIERSANGSTGWTQIGTTAGGEGQFIHSDVGGGGVAWYFHVKHQRPQWNDSAFCTAVQGTYGLDNFHARPIADISNGAALVPSSGATIWPMVDEVTADEDVTRAGAALDPTGSPTYTYEVKLGDLGTLFSSGRGIIVSVRHRGSGPSEFGLSHSCVPTLLLYEGATLRSSSGAFSSTGGPYRTDSWALTPAERAAISDHSNLRVRVSLFVTGNVSTGYAVTWIELDNTT